MAGEGAGPTVLSLVPPPSVCPICMEGFPALPTDTSTDTPDTSNPTSAMLSGSDGVVMDPDRLPVALGGCGHCFCRECVRYHVISCLSRGQVPACCPAAVCEAVLTLDEVRRVCDDGAVAGGGGGAASSATGSGTDAHYCTDTGIDIDGLLVDAADGEVVPLVPPRSVYERYSRLCALRTVDPNTGRPLHILCPRCDGLVAWEGPEPAVACGECGCTFCAVHSLAHPPTMACSEFEAQQPSEAEAASLRVVGDIAKPCPKCGVRIQLAAGCAHVKCPACDTDFCWKCGKANLTGTVFRKCATCQETYIEHRYMPYWGCLWCTCLPCWVCGSSLACTWVTVCCPCIALGQMGDPEAPTFREILKAVFMPFVCFWHVSLVQLGVGFDCCGLRCGQEAMR